jgi:hypothetical protein
VFPGYTYPVILDLPYDQWLLLAFAYDEYVAETKRIRASRGRGRRR